MAGDGKASSKTANVDADASAHTDAPPAGTAPGTTNDPPPRALDEASVKDYRAVLENSNAWLLQTDGVDLKFEEGQIRGPDSGLTRQAAGRLLALARNVLEANGYVVEGEYEPRLAIRVKGV